MIRAILSVIVGLMTAFLVMMAFEFTNSFLYPFPAGLDTGNSEQIKTFIESNSPNIFFLVIAGWSFGSLFGGFAATKTSKRNGVAIGLVTGAICTALQVLNFRFLPHPVWAMVIGMFETIPLFILGSKLALLRFREN